MIYFWFLCGIYGILCCTSFWSQFKQTVRGTYVISRCGSKNRQSVAGGRRRRGAASAECPHPQCALPRKAFCIFAATCINVDKKLLPLQVPQCCWVLAAWCCLLLPAVKTATSLCGKHLIVAHICAPNSVVQLELPLPQSLCMCLSFRLPFPFAIGKKRSGVEARRAALRCGACH